MKSILWPLKALHIYISATLEGDNKILVLSTHHHSGLQLKELLKKILLHLSFIGESTKNRLVLDFLVSDKLWDVFVFKKCDNCMLANLSASYI